jgi:hypothetical protein
MRMRQARRVEQCVGLGGSRHGSQPCARTEGFQILNRTEPCKEAHFLPWDHGLNPERKLLGSGIKTHQFLAFEVL